MHLYLQVTYQMSRKERVFGKRGKGMKQGFRKCSRADMGGKRNNKDKWKKHSHKENDHSSSKSRRPTKRTFTKVRKVAHDAKYLYGEGQGK